MKLTRTDRILLIIIIAVGAILRLWNLPNVPFTYDEFSALFRTQFDSFSDLITYGARIDGHPVGIQVFLYYWTQIFGFSEAWVKLPFILAGLASVYLIFRISWNWFGRSTAFLSASAMAFMQFPLIYSQISRPYSSGLFFVLLMVFFWSRLLFDKEKEYWRSFAGFVLGAALCTYNHYFSALMVVIVGMSGLFFVRGKFMWRYLLASALIMILYIPHFEIFLHQISLGGVEQWLAKPTPAFFKDYMRYIFHFSWPLYVGSLLLLHVGYIRGAVLRKHKWNKYFTLVIVWAVLPALIGYLYSIKVAAVLQFSVLIFSFPFLLMFLFGFFQLQKIRLTNILVIVFSLGLIITLIFERQHYKMFYNSHLEQGFAEVKNMEAQYDPAKTLVVYTVREEIAEYYSDEYKISGDQKFINYDSLQNIKVLTAELMSGKYDYVCLISPDPVLYRQISTLFPLVIKSRHLDQGGFYVFSKEESEESPDYYYSSDLLFNKDLNQNWNINTDCIITDTLTGEEYFQMHPGLEYGLSLVLPFDSILKSRMDYPEATAWVYLPDSLGEANLTMTIERDTSMIMFRAFPINTETVPVKQWVPVSGALFLPDNNADLDNTIMKVYIWNNGSSVRIKSMHVDFREGNKVLYWIVKGRQK